MKAAKPKPPHEEDVLFAAIAAKATRFTAVLIKGPGKRFREEVSTYAEACHAADALDHRHHLSGRRALIYAIGPRGESINVDPAIESLAGFPPRRKSK